MQENKHDWVHNFTNVIELSYNLTETQAMGYKY